MRVTAPLCLTPWLVAMACAAPPVVAPPADRPAVDLPAIAPDASAAADAPSSDALFDASAAADAPPSDALFDASAAADAPPSDALFDASADDDAPSDRADGPGADAPRNITEERRDAPAPDDAAWDAAEDDGPSPDRPAPGDVADAGAGATCLRVERTDLVALLARAPFASRSGAARMAVHPAGTARWAAARGAAIAWAAGDCAAFAAAAGAMGYDALEVLDTVGGLRHWVLVEATGAQYNGVFAFVAPADRGRARPLVIDSPHLGFDFSDARAPTAYREVGAVAFLQNTAHRCNSAACSGCSAITDYACGGCVVESDVVHSTGQLFYAVYDGLEAARDDLHFEYHGAGASNNVAGCAGSVHLSQASSRSLTAAADDGTWPNRAWRAFERSLGAPCVCYHQREAGCALNGGGSTAGRRTNLEAAAGPVDVCTAAPPRLAARFVHFEAYNVPVARVIDALREAVPAPP